uniref:sulfotransferase family protein n=1 Tax=Flavobacterium sp. TaxID=239 RepID=UPI00404A3B22
MKPDFILGGAMKSGTTFLHNLLQKHAQLKVLDRKMDYAYFDDDRIYVRGKDWYLKLFDNLNPDKGEQKLLGQTSADCNFNPKAVERILNHNPNMKLIFVLRHPIERTYSLYWHQYSMGREYRSFENALKNEKIILSKTYHNFKHYSFLERSRYKSQFDKINKLVKPENLLILDFDSLTKNTLPTLNCVFDFLDVKTINSLDEVSFITIPKNASTTPKYSLIVFCSYVLQKIGLLSLGRRLVYKFNKNIKPPKMSKETRLNLEIELKEDIDFFEKIKIDFRNKLNS